MGRSHFGLTLKDGRGTTTISGDPIVLALAAQRDNHYRDVRHDSRTHCERKWLVKNVTKDLSDPFDRYMADVEATERAYQTFETSPVTVNGPGSFSAVRHARKIAQKPPCPCYSLTAWPEHIERDILGKKTVTRWGARRRTPRLRYLGVEGYEFGSEDDDETSVLASLSKRKELDMDTFRDNLLLFMEEEGPLEVYKTLSPGDTSMSLEDAGEWYERRFGNISIGSDT